MAEEEVFCRLWGHVKVMTVTTALNWHRRSQQTLGYVVAQSSNLNCHLASHCCSFSVFLKIIIACIYIYLHIYIGLCLAPWTGRLLLGLMFLTASASGIHFQLLHVGDFLLVGHRDIHTWCKGRPELFHSSRVQNPPCADELLGGWGAMRVLVLFCSTEVLIFCLFRNLKILYLRMRSLLWSQALSPRVRAEQYSITEASSFVCIAMWSLIKNLTFCYFYCRWLLQWVPKKTAG